MPLIGDTVLGVAGCLVVAGLTEGIVTTWDLPLGLALGIGLLLAGGFWGLVAWRGRQEPAGSASVAASVAGTGAGAGVTAGPAAST